MLQGFWHLWQAWINGDFVGLALVACQEGFFLQVQVWCGPTLMQNMVVAAPLLNGTLHFDMDAITDTSLVRVTIYIPGGNTLTSSRVVTVTCLRRRGTKAPYNISILNVRIHSIREPDTVDIAHTIPARTFTGHM